MELRRRNIGGGRKKLPADMVRIRAVTLLTDKEWQWAKSGGNVSRYMAALAAEDMSRHTEAAYEGRRVIQGDGRHACGVMLLPRELSWARRHGSVSSYLGSLVARDMAEAERAAAGDGKEGEEA